VTEELGVSPAKCGARTHDVIDHCDALASDSASQRRRKQILGTVQSIPSGRHNALGEAELRFKGARNELRQKCAAEQRTADNRHIVRSERRGERRYERLYSPRIGKERIEIQPERTMVPGLEPEVSAPSLYNFEKRSSH
jgi:hypothetical protein